jgi:molybdopterin-binding protein
MIEGLPAGAVYAQPVPQFKVSQAAGLLGVSDDSVRRYRYIEAGTLTADKDAAKRMVIDGAVLAEFARGHSAATPESTEVRRSARNQLAGLVTSVVVDKVMAQVEIQCGPHRVVSLMSAEAAQELGLVPGSLAVVVIKSTDVMVEVPQP